MLRDDSFLAQRGNYRSLITFQKAECIYDITFHFAHRFLEKGDRTVDQMVQAARSGKQNIVEGASASATSKEMEIKLMNVAKASMHELLVDFEDYLRVRQLRQWQKGEPKFEQTRRYCTSHNSSADFRDKLPDRNDETIANIAIILIRQLDYLLFKQIETLKKAFLESGGIKEEMSRARRKVRGY
ncbi:MAG: four helix bundle suffix domain-containing protein [Bacteroides sp.]|nr:four helix bundle suffix domain-containing protein [Bacteroides sp.]MCM1457630.1 four helix bundle suffix domain-containing protein [Lachnoclostridium sp.]